MYCSINFDSFNKKMHISSVNIYADHLSALAMPVFVQPCKIMHASCFLIIYIIQNVYSFYK